MKLILMGPPMSGKGTQTQRLSEEKNADTISTGNILRKHVADGTELGIKAKNYMDKGELVPDDLIIALIDDKMSELGNNPSFILDGFPRTIEQAKALDKLLEGKGIALDHVIRLKVENEELMKRMGARITCEECGATYSISEEKSKCDKCGGKLSKRADDKVNTLINRLEVYTKQTAPLIDYYREKGLLREINGQRSPEEVFKEILNVIGG